MGSRLVLGDPDTAALDGVLPVRVRLSDLARLGHV